MSVSIRDPDRIGTTRLTDGRALGWAEWGPPDGTPVLLCPGAATSRRLGFGADSVEGLGVRLVSVDRPGLGASTPAPDRTFASFADDIRELSARRGLSRPAVVGNSQGAPFALACAVAGVAGAVSLVSAADELAAPEFADALPEGVRALVHDAAHAPEAAARHLAAFDADAMWDTVIAASAPSDVAVYRSAAFAASYRCALAEAFAPGPGGYVHDTLLAMRRWPFDLEKIAVPVDIWYGELDTSHSPDRGAFLSTRIPGARRHVVADVGGALLWVHAEPILRTLLGQHADR
ncbi:alpha/beta hydrolase [Nocardia asteroides]|nr:alpha/beta hydrolase [Nocardia asteroides]